jgi:hypothetical protein
MFTTKRLSVLRQSRLGSMMASGLREMSLMLLLGPVSSLRKSNFSGFVEISVKTALSRLITQLEAY